MLCLWDSKEGSYISMYIHSTFPTWMRNKSGMIQIKGEINKKERKQKETSKADCKDSIHNHDAVDNVDRSMKFSI